MITKDDIPPKYRGQDGLLKEASLKARIEIEAKVEEWANEIGTVPMLPILFAVALRVVKKKWGTEPMVSMMYNARDVMVNALKLNRALGDEDIKEDLDKMIKEAQTRSKATSIEEDLITAIEALAKKHGGTVTVERGFVDAPPPNFDFRDMLKKGDGNGSGNSGTFI